MPPKGRYRKLVICLCGRLSDDGMEVNVKKVIVIGCPGSGKSTFSKALNRITNIPLFHLDMIYWNEDKTTVEKTIFLDRLSKIIQDEEWIIDGNYNSTMELRMSACDTVIFLDYPLDLNNTKQSTGLS